MALDSNNLVQIREKQNEALNICKNEIISQLDAFKEILANINGWSNETAVGQDVAKNIIEIMNKIVKVVESTDSVCKALDDFCTRQERFIVH